MRAAWPSREREPEEEIKSREGQRGPQDESPAIKSMETILPADEGATAFFKGSLR